MKLKTAIKYNEAIKAGIDKREMPKHYAAIGLGIEALKRIKVIRGSWPKYTSELLPGETKE